MSERDPEINGKRHDTRHDTPERPGDVLGISDAPPEVDQGGGGLG